MVFGLFGDDNLNNRQSSLSQICDTEVFEQIGKTNIIKTQ